MKAKVKLIPKNDPRNLATKDPNRSANSRVPDTYIANVLFKSGHWYLLLADGWKTKCERNPPSWIPTGHTDPEECDGPRIFANEYLIKLLKSRNLWAESPPSKRTPRAESEGRKKGYSLTAALDEIEAAAWDEEIRNTALNTAVPCRMMKRRLPAESLRPPMNKISVQDIRVYLQRPIVQSPDLTLRTKEQYLQLLREVIEKLVMFYDLPQRFLGEPATPANMTGRDPKDRAFLEEHVKKMERKLRSARIKCIVDGPLGPGEISETAELLHAFGSAGGLQPADIVFRRWDDFDQDFDFVQGRRWKTSVRFWFGTSKRLRRLLKKRKARGGIWARGYIFPEIVEGILACRRGDCNLYELSQQEKEAILVNVTGRLADFYNAFLVTCDCKEDGISFTSYRHYNLPLLRSLCVADEVSMDWSGQETYEAFINYGDHGAQWEYERAAGLVESHWINTGLGRGGPKFLTISEFAAHSNAQRDEIRAHFDGRLNTLERKLDTRDEAILGKLVQIQTSMTEMATHSPFFVKPEVDLRLRSAEAAVDTLQTLNQNLLTIIAILLRFWPVHGAGTFGLPFSTYLLEAPSCLAGAPSSNGGAQAPDISPTSSREAVIDLPKQIPSPEEHQTLHGDEETAGNEKSMSESPLQNSSALQIGFAIAPELKTYRKIIFYVMARATAPLTIQEVCQAARPFVEQMGATGKTPMASFKAKFYVAAKKGELERVGDRFRLAQGDTPEPPRAAAA